MDERKRSQQTATDAPEFIRAVERLGLISFKNKKNYISNKVRVCSEGCHGTSFIVRGGCGFAEPKGI
jgi:subtilase family serine protease